MIYKILKKITPNKFLFAYRSYRAYIYGEKEIRVLKKLINPKKEAIDIGANLGEYTFWMSKHADHVHVFEPHPDCINFLKDVGLKNCTFYSYGVSSIASKKELLVPEDSSLQDITCRASISELSVREFEKLKGISINTIALDELGLSNIGFIKMDIEGHEFEALKGMRGLITSCNPVMQIEIEQRHHDASIGTIFEYIFDFGYSGFFLRNSKLVPIEEFDKVSCQSEILDLFNEDNSNFKESYVNNFIFIPNSDINDYIF